MLKILHKLFTFLKNNLLTKYFILLLSTFTKLQIQLLNCVEKKNLVYFGYIILMIYSFFGCLGYGTCNFYHAVGFFIVSYIMGTSIEIYFLSQIPITRRLLIKLIGENFFIAFVPSTGKQALKLNLPLYGLISLELLTTFLMHSFEINAQEACYKSYVELYGLDGQTWPEEIKFQYLEERSSKHFYKQGIVSYVAHKMNF